MQAARNLHDKISDILWSQAQDLFDNPTPFHPGDHLFYDHASAGEEGVEEPVRHAQRLALRFFWAAASAPCRLIALQTRVLAPCRVGWIAHLCRIGYFLVGRCAGHSRPQRDHFGGIYVDQHEVLVRLRFLLAAVLLLVLRGVGGTLATALGAVDDPIGGTRKRQGAGGDLDSRRAPAPCPERLRRVARRGASDASNSGTVVGSDRIASRAWFAADWASGTRGCRAACLPSATRRLWRRRPGVGAPCLPRSCLADSIRQRPPQRPAAHAQTLRVSVRSRPGTLAVCLVRSNR